MTTNQYIGLLCANIGVICLAFSFYCQRKVNGIIACRLSRIERHLWGMEDKP
mgnify:CR=1 FL=1